VIATLTVRLSFSFEEVFGAELSRAVIAGEVLRVPSLAQSCDYLHRERMEGAMEGDISIAEGFHEGYSDTCPTIGLSQAQQHPFCWVLTPCSVMWFAREPSIQSNSFTGVGSLGGGGGEGDLVFSGLA